MNKRLIIIIAAAAAVLLAFLWLGRRSLSPQQTLHLTPPIATNFRYPAQFTASEAYYFNGSAFLSFNLSNQTAKALTPIYALPNVLDVQWGKGGALFKANDYSVFDQLKPILDQKRLPATATYWWSVNFSTGEIKLIGTPRGPSTDGAASNGITVSSALWSTDGGSYYYIQTNLLRTQPQQNSLYVGSLSGPDKPLAQIEGSVLVWAGNNQAVYRVDTSKHALAKFNGQARTIQNLLDDFSGIAELSSSGNAALVINTSSKTGQEVLAEANGPLQLINLTDSSSPHTITNSFFGTFKWSRSANAWAAVGLNDKSKLTGYIDDGSGKIAALAFKLAPGQAATHLRVAGYEGGQILLIDHTNNAYLASPTKLTTKTVRPFKPSEWDYSGTEELMRHGLTTAQLGDLKYAIYQYSLASSQNPQKVNIAGVTIEPIDRKNPTGKAVADFTLTLDGRNKYSARLEYFDLTSIRLYLNDPKTKAQIYDSKTINNRTAE